MSDASGASSASNPHADRAGSVAATDADTLAYPISPDYVKSWTPVRALCELIANALDEDPRRTRRLGRRRPDHHRRRPRHPRGGPRSSATPPRPTTQIGQFGEGKKLACLVLARSPRDRRGALRDRRLRLHPDRRAPPAARRADPVAVRAGRGGPRLPPVTAPPAPAARSSPSPARATSPSEAIGRFRALTEPGYRPPPDTAERACSTASPAGSGSAASWSPPMPELPRLLRPAPGRQGAAEPRPHRHRGRRPARRGPRHPRRPARTRQLIDRFATHVLAGGKLREPEQFFTAVTQPRARAAWRTWARTHLPAQTFYTDARQRGSRARPDGQGLHRGRPPPGCPTLQQTALMDLLGVEIARTRQTTPLRTQPATRPPGSPSTPHRRRTHRLLSTLRTWSAGRSARSPWTGSRCTPQSDESPCADGFYNPRTGDVAIHRDALTDRHRTLLVLLHEAAHRVGHRGGGRLDRRPGLPRPQPAASSACSATSLPGCSATSPTALPYRESRRPVLAADRAVGIAGPTTRRVPAVRRELAHLLADQLPHALAAGGFATAKDMVASTAVYPDYWRTLTQPAPRRPPPACAAAGPGTTTRSP